MKKLTVVLFHLGYWTCYLFLMLVLMLLLNGHFIFRSLSLFIFLSAFALIPGILSFYSFYTVLFVKFLKRKKIILLVAAGVVTIFFCGSLGWFLLNLVWPHIGPAGKLPLSQGGYAEMGGITVIISVNALLNGIIALVMRGFIHWYDDIKLKESLHRKNFEMELALVKSQINPHFLFNTINNIDVLIEKDSQQASAYLNKLSDILRFMLYETKTGKVPLARELAYIGKYVDLQKIRSANSDYIHYSVEGNSGNQMIEPMLFIPFIENAFKHANKKATNVIDIQIRIQQNGIYFTCKNKYNALQLAQQGYNRLGNELIQKRLSLLYPGRHFLTVTDADGIYSITLMLTGNEN